MKGALISFIILFLLSSISNVTYIKKYQGLRAEVNEANKTILRKKQEHEDAVRKLGERTRELAELEEKYRGVIDSYNPDYPSIDFRLQNNPVHRGAGDSKANPDTFDKGAEASQCDVLLRETRERFEGVLNEYEEFRRSTEKILRGFEEDAKLASKVNLAYQSCRELILE